MSDKTPRKMNEGAWADLPAALDLAVFELRPGNRFQPVGNLPDWLAAFDLSRAADGALDLGVRFPVLELFLEQCGLSWDSAGQTRLTSDVWTELDRHGGEHYLQAAATW